MSSWPYAGSARCARYKFNFLRVEKTPTYSGVCSSPVLSGLVKVVVPGSWLWDRYEKWCAICERNDWASHLDLDGRTDWGGPIQDSLLDTLVPVTTETARLRRGVVNVKRRKHGRAYHCLTNLRKDLRRDCRIDSERCVEVDIHACYTTILISKLPDGEAKALAIAALHEGWYDQFGIAYDQWLVDQQSKGIAYQDGKNRWMLRVDADPTHDVPASIKVEYQRQCLFWRDNRSGQNPLRLTLRQLHPELCQLIEGLRTRMTSTELSHVLTCAEGSLFVDGALSELERVGIQAIPIHDAVVVPESKAEQALDVMLTAAEWHLEFRPRITLKRQDISHRQS